MRATETANLETRWQQAGAEALIERAKAAASAAAAAVFDERAAALEAALGSVSEALSEDIGRVITTLSLVSDRVRRARGCVRLLLPHYRRILLRPDLGVLSRALLSAVSGRVRLLTWHLWVAGVLHCVRDMAHAGSCLQQQ